METSKIQINEVDELIYRKGQEDTYEIYDINVRSKRGVGNGRKLVNILVEKENPRLIYAFTREGNEIAREFYEKLGFKQIFVPKFYHEENAVLVIYENSLYRQISEG